MEKIKLSYLKLFAVIIAYGALDHFVLSHYDKNSYHNFITIVSAFSAVLFTAFVFHKFSKSGIYFDKMGVTCTVGRETVFKKWQDVKIEKRINFSYLKLIYLNTEIRGKNFSLFLLWISEDSVINLTKKYVPANHELYSVVKDYSEKRGIKF